MFVIKMLSCFLFLIMSGFVFLPCCIPALYWLYLVRIVTICFWLLVARNHMSSSIFVQEMWIFRLEYNAYLFWLF